MNQVFYWLVVVAFVVAGAQFAMAPVSVPLTDVHRNKVIEAVDGSPDRTPEAVTATVLAALDEIGEQSPKFRDGADLVSRVERRGTIDGSLRTALIAELGATRPITGPEALAALTQAGSFDFASNGLRGLDEALAAKVSAVVDTLDTESPHQVADLVVETVRTGAGDSAIAWIEARGGLATSLRAELVERLAKTQMIDGERAAAALSSVGGFPYNERLPIQKFSDDLFAMAKAAVLNVVFPLVGSMTFFLGLMKVAEAAGAMAIIAKLLRPVMRVLFPDIPPSHPAMSAMILNMSANALGLGNAATPFGIRAMEELDKLNPNEGTATNAMCLFLAINTSAVTLLPTGVIAIREALGSQMSTAILPTTLAATFLSTLTAIGAAKLLQRFAPTPAPTDPDRVARVQQEIADATGDEGEAYPLWVSGAAMLGVLAFVGVALAFGEAIGIWVVPVLVVGFLTFGYARGVAVYEVFVEGAKEGWAVAQRIIPYLVVILAMVGMLRGSGAIAGFVWLVGEYTAELGMPAEALPLALLRPLSGQGSNGLMMALMNEFGPDSYTGFLVSTMQGSTDTTFYVIAVYFGAIGVQRIRHGLAAALLADFVGISASVAVSSAYFSLNGLW